MCYNKEGDFMKENHILITTGFLIYILLSSIDRWIYHIPHIVYIPIVILAIFLILIGRFFNKK